MKPKKTIKIEFAPGAFDGFEGTQEELDALIAEITRMAESGELIENSKKVDLDDLSDEEIELIAKAHDAESTFRKLQ